MNYEDKFINSILDKKDLGLLRDFGVKDEYFLSRQSIIKFIKQHQKQYKTIPSAQLVKEKFLEFEIGTNEDSNQFVTEKMREQFLYTKTVPLLKKSSEMVREDSVNALKFLRDNLNKLEKNYKINNNLGTDIISQAADRFADYKHRLEVDGLLGVSSGLRDLDEATHGWLDEELCIIFARTNMGKSWLLLFFLIHAWIQNKKVVMYSGEMGATQLGFRFDTILENFSNSALMSGCSDISNKTQKDKKDIEDYKEYIQLLRKQNPFVILTQKDFDGAPTVEQIKERIEIEEADIVGIDQLTLMNDQNNAKESWNRYTNIAKDLYQLSEEKQIPILALTQANREGVGQNNEEVPQMHHVAGSDGVARNATRVISFVKVDDVLKVKLLKNRYGKKEQEFLYHWDIDSGYLKPLLDSCREDIDKELNNKGF